MTKKKKRTRMIAAVLLLAVLAVTYVLVLRADFNGEDVEEETEEIMVLEIEREDISTVRLENSYGTLQFAYDGETWTSEDDPAFQLNQDSMSALFNRLNPLTAVRDLGEQEYLEAYGLAEPVITISITLQDGQEIAVYLGNDSSDGNLYFMTSESSSIYTGDSYLATAFDCQLSDLEAEEEEEEEEEDASSEESAESSEDASAEEESAESSSDSSEEESSESAEESSVEEETVSGE